MRVVLIMIFITSLFANEFVVVASKDSKIEKVSKRLLRDIYLKKRIFINDKEVIPINLEPQSEIRLNFEEEILNMDRDEINNFWIKNHYQGITPPIVQKSEEGLKLFIKNVDGAIGYIQKEKLTDELKVIYEF